MAATTAANGVDDASLRRGGDLWNALVEPPAGGGAGGMGAYHRSFYHPLFPGVRFDLPPGGRSLVARSVRTVSASEFASFPPSVLSRGGAVYDAALKAGKSSEWGPLEEGATYHVWAVPPGEEAEEEDGGNGRCRLRAFALRRPAAGRTVPFAYDRSLDRLVSKLPLPPRPSVGGGGASDPPPPSAADVRARRLERFGGGRSTTAGSTLRPAAVEERRSPPSRPPTSGEPAVASSSSCGGPLRFATNPESRNDVAAGAVAVLEAEALRNSNDDGDGGGDGDIRYRWFFVPRRRRSSVCGAVHQPEEEEVPGATRKSLRLDPVLLGSEGTYFCEARLEGARCATTIRSVPAEVSLASLDRRILTAIDELTKRAEEILPPVESCGFEPPPPDNDEGTRNAYARLADDITDLLDLKAMRRRSSGSREEEDPAEAEGEDRTSFRDCDEETLRRRAKALPDQLPLEVSALLVYRARARLAAGANAASGSDEVVATTAERARRDAAAALRILPGDRDALLVHAAAAELSGRLGDAIESLELLRRLGGGGGSAGQQPSCRSRRRSDSDSRAAASDAPPSSSSKSSSPAWDDIGARIDGLSSRLEEQRRKHRRDAAHREKMGAAPRRRCDFPRGTWFDEDGGDGRRSGGGDDATDDEPPPARGGRSRGGSAAADAIPPPPTAVGENWRDAFRAREEDWATFVAQTASPVRDPSDVPWPEGSAEGFRYVGVENAPGSTRRERIRAVRAMLLRFHPDKFAQRLSGRFANEDARRACLERSLDVARRLTALMESIDEAAVHAPPLGTRRQ